jgi:hypothetical protein
VLLIAVFFARLPWMATGQLNPDESQFLAGAIRLLHDPVFWRSVDGGTSGPLNFYALLLPHFLGFPLDYATAHLMNAVCSGGAVIFLFLIARFLLDETVARLSVLPILLAVLNFVNPDLLHYSSECVSVFLIAMAAWLLAAEYLGTARTVWRFAGLGLITVALPLAKLQSAPLALVLGGAALALAISRVRTAAWRPTVALIAGAAGVLVILLIVLVAFGQFPTFWKTYIENNIRYANANPVAPWTPASFRSFVMNSGISPLIKTAGIYFIFVVFLQLYRRVTAVRPSVDAFPAPAPYVNWLFALILFAAGVYAFYRPMRPFSHYLLLLVVPIGLLIVAACALHLVKGQRFNGFQAALFLVITVAGQLYWSIGVPRTDTLVLLSVPAVFVCPACDTIGRFAKPGDLVSIWGWSPEIYVRTRTVHASHEGCTPFQILKSPLQAYYLDRYLNDLDRTMPPVFVDAVGPRHFTFEDRTLYSHEIHPELKAFVQSNYNLAEDVDGARVYVRKDISGRVNRLSGIELLNR